ncbi:MAG: hypothetical protein ACRCXA_00715 [Peptostreptococcaceae bacterium]
MKKTLLLGLVISLGLGVTACNSVEKEKQEGIVNKQENENQVLKEEKFIYGKVKKIVGNEVEFELANNPDKSIEGVEKEEENNNKTETTESVPATMTTPAQEGTTDKKVNVGKIEKNEPIIELDFTGDVQTIIIPTGANINILSGRSGEGLSVIKEGTYLRLSVDDDKSENPTVLSVDVIS